MLTGQLCASGAGIGISVLGLSLASEDRDAAPSTSTSTSKREHSARTNPSSRDMSATATATCTIPPSEPYAFSFTPPDRRLRDCDAPRFGRSHSENAQRTIRKNMEPPRVSTNTSSGAFIRSDDSESSRASTPGLQPRSWLRRLSSLSTSRDSTRTSASRPSSAAVSHSNGSLAFSNTSSTAAMFPDSTPRPPTRNKLVKRSSSARSVNSSPFQTSGSRLPIPTFRRPATSHQRSATLHERSLSTPRDSPVIHSDPVGHSQEEWRHYFTPKVAELKRPKSRRRSSTSIPNPIKRVYPDRRYTPTLVSSQHRIWQAGVEADDELSLSDAEETMPSSVASSPMFPPGRDFHEEPRRSFSISDLLSTGPSQNIWRPRSSRQSRSSTGGSKLTRSTTVGSSRIASAPQSTMGSSFSSSRNESERPSKRREVTNPETASRSIYSSSSGTYHNDLSVPREIQLNLNTEVSRASTSSAPQSAGAEPFPKIFEASAVEQRRLPSATSTSATQRPGRAATAASEITSTLGSDSEYVSVGDVSTDGFSDAYYDSIPTRTTRSSSGKRGPSIETIFDESPPTFSSGRSTKLKDFLAAGSFSPADYGEAQRYSTIEEEESVSTPVRSLAGKSSTSSPSAARNVFASSPPVMREMPDPDEIDWDTPEEDPEPRPTLGSGKIGTANKVQGPVFQAETSLPFRLAPFGRTARSQHSNSSTSTPQRNGGGSADRATIFDWSEAQPSPSHNHSPPRPKTVHGKKDPESRGSRPPGRRVPSGMHARSHSVPIVPDLDGKRSPSVANKFGTWGVGHAKGVTEDWNEDFDFDLGAPELPATPLTEERRIDSGHEMFVPRSIREQQQNVVANISLLREWGLLIEELKELRIRAVALNMLKGPHARSWSEVDAMIELADQESEEHTLDPRQSPPSSPGFDFDAFDEPAGDATEASRTRSTSIRTPEPPPAGFKSSLLTIDEPMTPDHPVFGRPRKDSEAVARSVIEALHSKRSVSDPTAIQPVQPTKKVPFDTATLRHIVPYVSGLKRQVKDALRETEGLYTSPNRHSAGGPVMGSMIDEEYDEPSFRSIFNEPQPGSPSHAQNARRNGAVTDHDESEQ